MVHMVVKLVHVAQIEGKVRNSRIIFVFFFPFATKKKKEKKEK